MCLAPESDALSYKKPIRINEMVGPEGLERQRPTVFDLPIMSRMACGEAGQQAEER